MGSPVAGHEVEVGEMRPTLDVDRPDLGKPVDGPGRRDSVAVPDEKLRPSERLSAVPRPADQRSCVPIPAASQELEHTLQDSLQHLVGRMRPR